jgi:hypothetical protein
MPELALQIITYVQLALKAAPAVKELYDEAKNLFQSLYQKDLITLEQQNQLMTWADAHQAAVLAGEVPPEFQVQ